MSNMREALNRESESWRPEKPGDEVYGEVTHLSEVDSQYGTSPVVTVVTEDGREVRINGFGAVLQGAIYSSGVEIGDQFGVRFKGKVRAASGNEYRDFKVVVLGPDGKPKRSRTSFAPVAAADDELPAFGGEPAPFAPTLVPNPAEEPF